MARPKEFETETALQGALEVFQRRGYEGASIQELLDGMGICRQSLYDTFGGKEKLFNAALERYRLKVPASLGSVLEGPFPLKKALKQFFQQAAAFLQAPEGIPCFLAQTALRRVGDDPASARCVREAFRQNVLRLENRLKRAQREGELGAHQDPAALARFFQNALHGLQITIRSGGSADDVKDIIRATLSILG